MFGGLDGVRAPSACVASPAQVIRIPPPQIVTTFAIVASVVGASLSAEVVVISGFAKLVGDGIASACCPVHCVVRPPAATRPFPSPCAVGMGDTVSEIAEMAYVKGERAREMDETERMLE